MIQQINNMRRSVDRLIDKLKIINKTTKRTNYNIKKAIKFCTKTKRRLDDVKYELKEEGTL